MTVADVSVVGLHQEIIDSIAHLHEGVHVLARPSNWRFNVAALNVSTGLERLIKVILILDDLHHNRNLNRNFYQHTLSHDIQRGFEELTRRQLWSSWDSAPPMWEDERVIKVIHIFRNSSGTKRYAYSDHIFSNSPTLDTPARDYDRFLMEIGSTMAGYNESFGTPAVQAFVNATKAEGVATVQRIARGLCRIFTLSPIKETASTYSCLLDPFLTLQDGELKHPRPIPVE